MAAPFLCWGRSEIWRRWAKFGHSILQRGRHKLGPPLFIFLPGGVGAIT